MKANVNFAPAVPANDPAPQLPSEAAYAKRALQEAIAELGWDHPAVDRLREHVERVCQAA